MGRRKGGHFNYKLLLVEKFRQRFHNEYLEK